MKWIFRSRPEQSGLLEQGCREIEKKDLGNRGFFDEFKLNSGHPWEETAKSGITTYYSCLYEIVKKERPKKILEIGTAFGLSAAAMLKAADNLELFVSLDLGIYGNQYGFDEDNIEFTSKKIHAWCEKNNISKDKVKFYKVNTQPAGLGDNDDAGANVESWDKILELVSLLEANKFDVIFVDGKHTDSGLFNDMNTFWPFLKNGGLMICDDLHDKKIYKKIFTWAGDTLKSYNKLLKIKAEEIADYYIWNFPKVPPDNFMGLRPFGLIRKNFQTFNSVDAIEINKARLEHLASLSLDLDNKTVLEVGSGVGWLTNFFEKRGCEILSTDARSENVIESKRRYPDRKVEIADLSIPGSHERFGKFDIVFCYGTLYHLKDPALCISELSKNCSDLFLLETCVNPEDNGQINPIAENKNNPNQSYEAMGCRPGRDWLMAELKKYYPFVYVTATQPDYKDFPLKWPTTLPNGVLNARAVFVASRKKLDLPVLLTSLPIEQTKNNTKSRFSGKKHIAGLLISSIIISFLILTLVLYNKSPFIGYGADQNIKGRIAARVKHALSVVENLSSEKRAAKNSLKEKIIAEVPVLSDKTVSDWEKVNELRNWVFKNIPMATEYDLRIGVYANVSSAVMLPVTERFRMFENGEAGVLCAGMAETLADIYNLFGYQSYVVSSGDSGYEATHAVTLVKILHNNKEILAIEDPYYDNRAFADKNGNPMDYFDFLSYLKDKKADEIGVIHGNKKRALYLIRNEDLLNGDLVSVFENGNKIVRYKFTSPDFDNAVSRFVTNHGFPDDSLYLFSFPFGVWSPNTDAYHILSKAKEISGV